MFTSHNQVGLENLALGSMCAKSEFNALTRFSLGASVGCAIGMASASTAASLAGEDHGNHEFVS